MQLRFIVQCLPVVGKRLHSRSQRRNENPSV